MQTQAERTDALTELLRDIRHFEKLLQRSVPGIEDPVHVATIWRRSNESRDHGRILDRHRTRRYPAAPRVRYPRWARGKGPTPEEAIRGAIGIADSLVERLTPVSRWEVNHYIRKYLAILGEEYHRLADELRTIAKEEEVPELAELSRSA